MGNIGSIERGPCFLSSIFSMETWPVCSKISILRFLFAWRKIQDSGNLADSRSSLSLSLARRKWGIPKFFSRSSRSSFAFSPQFIRIFASCSLFRIWPLKFFRGGSLVEEKIFPKRRKTELGSPSMAPTSQIPTASRFPFWFAYFSRVPFFHASELWTFILVFRGPHSIPEEDIYDSDRNLMKFRMDQLQFTKARYFWVAIPRVLSLYSYAGTITCESAEKLKFWFGLACGI